MQSNQTTAAEYDTVAEEYYDPKLHPTCANFGELSENFLRPRLKSFGAEAKRTLEVGAGRSTVAKLFDELGFAINSLVLLDESERMLTHSSIWKSRSAQTVIANAERTGLPSKNFDLIVSSLGDPYNTLAFWCEMRRLVTDHGRILFTTPSYEWACRFRPQAELDQAEFVLRDGKRVHVSSYVFCLDEQRRIFDRSHIQITECALIALHELRGIRSPKLEVVNESDPAMYGFVLAPH